MSAACVAKRLGGSKAKFKWKYACIWHMQGGKQTTKYHKSPQEEPTEWNIIQTIERNIMWKATWKIISKVPCRLF